MSRSTVIIPFVLLGSLVALGGCDKGPKTKEPAPAKAADKAADKAAVPPAKAAGDTPADEKGKVYGAGVTLKDSTSISAILDKPDDFKGKAVRVEGMLVDVCSKRGCWIEMAGDAPGKKMRFKVQDGVMVFPVTDKGKYAVAEGVVSVNALSLEDSRKHAAHDAEERGEKIDPASITEPVVVVRLDGTGAVVRDAK
jgi:hypothetical protein